VTGWLVLTLTFDPTILKRASYRFTHKVYGMQDVGTSYPKREVAVQLRNADSPAADANACIRAFEILSVNEDQTATCRVFVSRASYERYRAGDLSCELARAMQMPYGTAGSAVTTVNTGPRCP